ncbi:hypothetical protein Tco_1581205 [Tanacetum coccineum]
MRQMTVFQFTRDNFPVSRSSYARAMIELRADVELKDNIVSAMPKLLERATILVILVLSMSRNLLDVPVVRFLWKPKDRCNSGIKENLDYLEATPTLY